MIFLRPSLSDRQKVVERFAKGSDLSCEYTFGNIYAYQAKYDIFIGEAADCIITKCCTGGTPEYCYPVGGNVKAAVEAIIEDAKKNGHTVRLFGLNSAAAKQLETLFPGKFDIRMNRDACDYIYLVSDLADLEGKRYQQKRNHISFFERNNIWQYEEISRATINECLEMGHEWLNDSPPDRYEELYLEELAIKRAFEAFDELRFRGGLLRADGRVIAYTMGEAIDSETFCVHYEKAFAQIRGAYPMINREFVRNSLTDYKYVNREDDVGIENLRKAKLSYHPYRLFEKYDAEIK